MDFHRWLKTSNEAAAFRIAFDCVDKIPTDHGLKLAAFEAVRAKAESAWQATKNDLWSVK